MKKWSEMGRWQNFVPSLVTLAGLVLSGCWLGGAPWYVGLVGLLCDVADGHIARKIGAVSKFGSLFDWTTDVVVLAVLCGRLGMWPAALALVPGQVVLRLREVRFSGRAAATLLVIGLQVLGIVSLTGCVDDVQQQINNTVDDAALRTCDFRCEHGFCSAGQSCMCPWGGGWSDATPWCKTCYDPESMDRGVPVAIPCR